MTPPPKHLSLLNLMQKLHRRTQKRMILPNNDPASQIVSRRLWWNLVVQGFLQFHKQVLTKDFQRRSDGLLLYLQLSAKIYDERGEGV